MTTQQTQQTKQTIRDFFASPAGIDHETFDLLGPWSKLDSVTRAGDEVIARDIDLDSAQVRISYRTGRVRIVSRLDGRALTTDDIKVVACQRRERLDQIAAAQSQAQAAYHQHSAAMRDWEAAAGAFARQAVGEAPTRRVVKRGRKITKAEGRRMALDCGFDPAAGMYHEDPEDATLANEEFAAAREAWAGRNTAAIAQFEVEHPKPLRPGMKPWHCYSVTLADRELPR